MGSGEAEEDFVRLSDSCRVECRLREAIITKRWASEFFQEGTVVLVAHGMTPQLTTNSRLLLGSLEAVADFGAKLRATMMGILDGVDRSWLQSAPNGAVAVVLSGGGATLPMVQELAQGPMTSQGVGLKLVKVKDFPDWMAEHDEYVQFEEEYPRIAVHHTGKARIHGCNARHMYAQMRACFSRCQLLYGLDYRLRVVRSLNRRDDDEHVTAV